MDENSRLEALERKAEGEIEKVEEDIDMLSKVTFLDGLLNKQNEIRNMLDMRANIVIGFNSALIVILLGAFKAELTNNPILVLLLVILVLSLILSIVALKPPHITTKRGQHESLFYHHYIESKDPEEYRREIREALDDDSKMFDAYIAEVYNLTKYSNIPRKFYLNLSIKVLIYGITLAILIYLVNFIVGYIGG